MTAYALYTLDMSQIKTTEEYNAALRKPPTKYFDRLRELEEYCGGKLHPMNGAYHGSKGNTDFIAYKVKI